MVCLFESHTISHSSETQTGPTGVEAYLLFLQHKNSLAHVLALPLACRIAQDRWDLTQLWGNGQKTSFFSPLPFHFEADSSRFLTAAVTDWNLENMGNSRKRGKTNCFGFYSSNYSQLTPAWWLFVFLFTDTHLQTCYTWGIRFSWSIHIFFPTLLIVLDQLSDCENGRAPPFGWRFWPGNSSTVFNPSVRVSELHWWKESCFSRSGRK